MCPPTIFKLLKIINIQNIPVWNYKCIFIHELLYMFSMKLLLAGIALHSIMVGCSQVRALGTQRIESINRQI